MRQERNGQEDKLLVQASDLRAAHQEVQQLRDEKDKHIVTAEQETLKARKREVELMAKIKELEATVEKANNTRNDEEDRYRVLEQDKIRELDAKVALLAREKTQMLERQDTLLERYGAGNLVCCSNVHSQCWPDIFCASTSPTLKRILLRCWFKMLKTYTNRRQWRKITRLKG